MDAFHIRSTYSACVRSLSAFPNTTSSSVATAAAVKPIRERPDLLTPANASDSSLLLRHKKSPHIQKEPYSAPPDNLEGHKTAYYVDHRMWTIRSSPQQSIWIGTKHSLVTKTTGKRLQMRSWIEPDQNIQLSTDKLCRNVNRKRRMARPRFPGLEYSLLWAYSDQNSTSFFFLFLSAPGRL